MSSKPNLKKKKFLSEGLEDRLLSALEIKGNGVGRIKARKIFSSKYIQFQIICTWHIGTVVEYQRLTPKVVSSSPGIICLVLLFLYPAASD
jgi:hypothetical protein